MIILSLGVLQKGIYNTNIDQNVCNNVIGFVVTEKKLMTKLSPQNYGWLSTTPNTKALVLLLDH